MGEVGILEYRDVHGKDMDVHRKGRDVTVLTVTDMCLPVFNQCRVMH